MITLSEYSDVGGDTEENKMDTVFAPHGTTMAMCLDSCLVSTCSVIPTTSLCLDIVGDEVDSATRRASHVVYYCVILGRSELFSHDTHTTRPIDGLEHKYSKTTSCLRSVVHARQHRRKERKAYDA
jgi:hypothetical protein